MSKKQDIFDDDSLEKESPFLHSIPKNNPFTVPRDYFDSLPSEIVEKCREEVVSRQSSVSSKNPISYIFYLISLYKWRLLTATGCVVIICIFAIKMNNRPVSYETMMQNIPDSLIVEHLDKNIGYINESTLEELAVSQNNSSSLQSKSDSANADEDIVAYLINNNVSVSEIENVP